MAHLLSWFRLLTDRRSFRSELAEGRGNKNTAHDDMRPDWRPMSPLLDCSRSTREGVDSRHANAALVTGAGCVLKLDYLERKQ